MAEIKLRYYQKDAADAFEKYLMENETGNGVIDFPTGAGKSYLLAELTRRFAGNYNARILIVSHTQFIVKQDFDSTSRLWPEGKPLFGINSAGLGRRDYKHKVLFCGIQSVYKDAALIGKVNFLIIDEAHKVNMQTSVQYKGFIEGLLAIKPVMRVCGLSASPFRMNSGLIYGPSSSLLFDHLVYRANMKELIAQGYLAKPITPEVSKENWIKTEGVKIKTTGTQDFDEEELEKRVVVSSLIKSQVSEVLRNSGNMFSIAAFAVNIHHAEKVAEEFRVQGENSVAVIHSKVKKKLSMELVDKYKKRELRTLVSVNMIVEGFDAPNIEIIMDAKPTCSQGRYVQMYGRGGRLCPEIGKTTFTIFDYAGNVGRHGPIDIVEPEKEEEERKAIRSPGKQCEQCGRRVNPKMKICPYCGWLFPIFISKAEENTNAKAGNISIISEPRWFNVDNLHCAKSRDNLSIVAHYYCVGGEKFTKKIAFDEEGDRWLRNHLGDDLPFDIHNFFNGGYRSKLKKPRRIFVDEAGSASEIKNYEF
ncbi:MAG: DEAD/DEAH box helicase family protein [Candidatus Zixiibacteriota bacterium]|nr:MAG: DEAD/DEAH box helicase family protein [candidate division Zixibacteria bacterium]